MTHPTWHVYDRVTGRFFGQVRCVDGCEAITTVHDHYEPASDLTGADLYAEREFDPLDEDEPGAAEAAPGTANARCG